MTLEAPENKYFFSPGSGRDLGQTLVPGKGREGKGHFPDPRGASGKVTLWNTLWLRHW